jgi:hypothetical protein
MPRLGVQRWLETSCGTVEAARIRNHDPCALLALHQRTVPELCIELDCETRLKYKPVHGTQPVVIVGGIINERRPVDAHK